VDDISVEIGHRYDSPAVIAEPGERHAPYEHPHESKGRPGTRAPHVFLTRDESRVSTLDLFGARFVMLTGSDGCAWAAAGRDAAADLGITLDTQVIGGGVTDADSAFVDAYGVTAAGAVLVRPDGIVAWRAADGAEGPAAVMKDVLASLHCRQ
jgi:hypothetical protein